MRLLYPLHTIGNSHNCISAFDQFGWDNRLDVGLFLEDEAGEEGDDFFGFVCCECILEDEFGEDEFVGGVDLGVEFSEYVCYESEEMEKTYFTCYSTFEQDGRVIVDELEFFENLDSLLIVGDQLEILVRDS